MTEEKNTEQIEDNLEEKKDIIVWVKEHKMQLLYTGISVSALIMMIFGIKNKDAINGLWETLKKRIEKGSLYSVKWFENASLEELEKAREIIRLDCVNPNLDLDYRSKCWDMLPKFDNAIGKIKWAGKEVGYPVYSSHGWHLPSDD